MDVKGKRREQGKQYKRFYRRVKKCDKTKKKEKGKEKEKEIKRKRGT